jgi:hypothetical protein
VSHSNEFGETKCLSADNHQLLGRKTTLSSAQQGFTQYEWNSKLLALLNWFKLVYGPEQGNMQHSLDFCPNQPGPNGIDSTILMISKT